jgi:hypothetical protein
MPVISQVVHTPHRFSHLVVAHTLLWDRMASLPFLYPDGPDVLVAVFLVPRPVLDPHPVEQMEEACVEDDEEANEGDLVSVVVSFVDLDLVELRRCPPPSEWESRPPS